MYFSCNSLISLTLYSKFIFSIVPFHIECDSPPSTVGTQLEAIEVLFDGSTLVISNNIFTYLENPEIEGITPKKGIAR